MRKKGEARLARLIREGTKVQENFATVCFGNGSVLSQVMYIDAWCEFIPAKVRESEQFLTVTIRKKYGLRVEERFVLLFQSVCAVSDVSAKVRVLVDGVRVTVIVD